MAARLKQLGVPTLIVDRNARIGDNWRNRYHQLVLHDSVWYARSLSSRLDTHFLIAVRLMVLDRYDHMPYLKVSIQVPSHF